MLIKATMKDVLREKVNGTTNLYVVDAMENPMWEVSVTAVDMTTEEITVKPFIEDSDAEVNVSLKSLRMSV